MGKHSHHESKKLSKDKHNEGKEEQHFTSQQAYRVARCLGIEFGSCGYDLEQFRIGMDVELEHGMINRHTNITYDDPILTGKIALAHLNEFPDYYVRLVKMEKEADKYWSRQKKTEHDDEHDKDKK